jgi:adenosylcobinamide-GDP ribazoletransferase
MWADLRTAFSFLTILPLGQVEGRKGGWSLAGYPLVGLFVGGLLALLAQVSPFAPGVTAFLVLAAWAIITGGLHLDGFGDSCDALLATVEPARRLEIMKDPRAGSWAVVGLLLLLLGKWVTIGSLAPVWLLLPPVIGRWVMAMGAALYPYARASGLGSYFRAGLGRAQLITATLLTLSIALLLTRSLLPLLVVLSAGLLTLFGLGAWAARRLGGGLTGDVYGAMCEFCELLCLLGLSLWASA